MTPNPNPHGGFKPGSHEVLNGILVHGNVSGWYARLDRVLDDREAQIDAWLSSWERSLQQNLPIAAFLPETWPTLPANLITDPGYVLDHLLARHDAELDGRSPRGAQPIPTILSDSMVTSELLDVPNQSGSNGPMQMTNLDALPPGSEHRSSDFVSMVKMMWLASARNEFMRMLNPDSAHGLASHSQSRIPHVEEDISSHVCCGVTPRTQRGWIPARGWRIRRGS